MHLPSLPTCHFEIIIPLVLLVCLSYLYARNRVEEECQKLARCGDAPHTYSFPPIEVIVANGDEDITFKVVCSRRQTCVDYLPVPYYDYVFHTPLQVSDRGGGVKRSQINHCYKFFTSSCKLGSRGLRWVSFYLCSLCPPSTLSTDRPSTTAASFIWKNIVPCDFNLIAGLLKLYFVLYFY